MIAWRFHKQVTKNTTKRSISAANLRQDAVLVCSIDEVLDSEPCSIDVVLDSELCSIDAVLDSEPCSIEIGRRLDLSVTVF